MKQVLKALSVVLVLAGMAMAQQETSPDIYPDKSPAPTQKTVTAKKPSTKKAQKPAAKTTLVAAKTPVKAQHTHSN